VVHGGRFFHLTGPTDKGRALRELLALLSPRGRRFATVGLGDAANDLPLLEAVERPIVVPRPGGEPDAALAAALPAAERAPAPGPEGWNGAVLTVLSGGRLPAIAERRGGGAR
jgi:mannosyl-3-phosphoglycerate phosphatase